MDLSFLPPELRINISEYAGTRGSRALASTNRRMRSIYSDTAFDKLILKRAINNRQDVIREFAVIMLILIKSTASSIPGYFPSLVENFINRVFEQRFSVTTGTEDDMSLPINVYKQAINDDIMAFASGVNQATSHSDLYDAVLASSNRESSGFLDIMSVFLGTMATVTPGDFDSLMRTFVKNAFGFVKDLITNIEVPNEDGTLRRITIDNTKGVEQLDFCEDAIELLLDELQTYRGVMQFKRIMNQAEDVLIEISMNPRYLLTEDEVAPMTRASFNMKRRGRGRRRY